MVAEAVAEAWTRLAAAADEPSAGSDQTVLPGYDPADLANLCTAVDPHPLTWHVAAVINAWPDQPAVQDFAEKLITDIRPLSSGIPDTIPVAILRAYCARIDARSQRICNRALSQLMHIDPELREVLAFELTRSALPIGDLVDVLADWEKEPDSEVRRTAFIGLVQAIRRHQRAHDQTAGADVLSDQMRWLLQKIKDNLCAYGPDLDDLRQLAWIGMLMLGDLTLSDGITERIGQPRPVGVRLDRSPDGAIDQILVDLVAENWDRLREHFGDDVFRRFERSSAGPSDATAKRRREVMSALATAAARFQAIAEMLRQEADIDPKLRQDPPFLLWAKHENGGDEAVLRALAEKLGPTMTSWANQVLEAVLDRDSWRVPDETLKAVLTEDARTTRSGARIPTSAKLAAYAELFPEDEVSIAAFRDLEEWFGEDRSRRIAREWHDMLALALAVAPPQDLPAILVRVHERFRETGSVHLLPAHMNPLVRRLRRDTLAVDAFKDAIREPTGIREESPLFTTEPDPISARCLDTRPVQRAYLFAIALRQAGALPQREATSAIAMLTSTSTDTVALNPFTYREGPLHLASLDLLHL